MTTEKNKLGHDHHGFGSKLGELFIWVHYEKIPILVSIGIPPALWDPPVYCKVTHFLFKISFFFFLQFIDVSRPKNTDRWFLKKINQVIHKNYKFWPKVLPDKLFLYLKTKFTFFGKCSHFYFKFDNFIVLRGKFYIRNNYHPEVIWANLEI